MKIVLRILLKLSRMKILYLSDETYIKCGYRYWINQKLNLKEPRTFNEKLQWLKINDKNPEYTKMVDKYEAKKYVCNKIGKEYIIPTLGIWNNFDDIDFSKLPNQFVIKCTHDSGGLIICKDKSDLDISKARKKINKCLRRNYYDFGKEWPYKNIQPRIIVEEYMEDNKLKELRDYKFFCFNGKVQFFKIDFDRFIEHRANYYDIEGRILPFGEQICPPDFNKNLDMPYNLNRMIELAEKLSKDIKFVRIDFYETNNKIFFGEFTFFPASGYGKFIPEEWDLKLGNLLKLQ